MSPLYTPSVQQCTRVAEVEPKNRSLWCTSEWTAWKDVLSSSSPLEWWVCLRVRTNLRHLSQWHAIHPVHRQVYLCIPRGALHFQSSVSALLLLYRYTHQQHELVATRLRAKRSGTADANEPLSPLVHMDVPSSVALYIHVLSYCRMLRLANVLARTVDCAGTNSQRIQKPAAL